MPLNQDAINRDLRERKDSDMQKKLLKEVLQYLKVSSDHMSTYWNTWAENDNLYRGYRLEDKKDKEQKSRGNPTKIIVPIVYAQLQSYISFVFSTFTQKDYFYEIRGIGAEDQRYKEGIEMDIEHQVQKNKFLFKLYMWLLQAGKYGFGVTKLSWETEKELVRSHKKAEPALIAKLVKSVFKGQSPDVYEEVIREIITYEGNKIENISPYAFFPDPDVPLARFQEGAFVAHEEEMTLSTIRGKEGLLYHGTNHIPEEMERDLVDYRARRYRNTVDSMENKSVYGMGSVKQAFITEAVITLIPSEWKDKNKIDIDIGDEKYPVKYLVTIANDQKIIRFEPYGYLHNKFGYSLIEYSPDYDSFMNPGLTGTIQELQNLMSWFLNSHVSNVSRAIRNRFIGNAEKVMEGDISNDSLFIRTKNNADVGKVLQQLQVTDVTRSHVQDMEVLNKLVQLTTGISENALGQYATGRRSAFESRQVTASAAARLKMHAQLHWMQGIEPLGKMMISNTRQGRSEDLYNMIVGEKSIECPYDRTILADPAQIAGGYDFVPYDATLPSDRINQANMYRELLEVIMKNPESAVVFNKDPAKLLDHIFNLLGVRNLDDFNLQQQPMQAQVADDAMLQQAMEQGAQPVDLGPEAILQQLGGQI